MSSTTTATARPTIVTRRRRLSSFCAGPAGAKASHFPPSLDGLSLEAPTVVRVRTQVLAYLQDLEARLLLFASPPADDAAGDETASEGSPTDATGSAAERALADAHAWAADGLATLRQIRADVLAGLPAFEDLRALPALDLDGLRDTLSSALSDLPSPFPFDFDFELAPRAVLPSLAARLESLHAHVAAMAPPALRLPPFEFGLADLLARAQVRGSALVDRFTAEPAAEDSVLERAAKDLAAAVRASMHGARLIAYEELPHKWRNNQFVAGGYRFIPLEKWPLIVLSLFAIHNETLNIHTHLVPFLFWLATFLPGASSAAMDAPEQLFLVFALTCLFCSSVWHTMAGCAHAEGMDLCARIDYVGIGWLISASVGTVAHYGFQDHENTRNFYLAVCFAMGLAGSIFPFMEWFNQRKYKLYRVAFFLVLAFSALAPLAHLAALTSPATAHAFIAPIVPSFRSYLVGLVFYVTHFPECVLHKRAGTGRWRRVLNAAGGGSHAIWHLWIVLAIYQHKEGMKAMKAGIPGL